MLLLRTPPKGLTGTYHPAATSKPYIIDHSAVQIHTNSDICAEQLRLTSKLLARAPPPRGPCSLLSRFTKVKSPLTTSMEQRPSPGPVKTSGIHGTRTSSRDFPFGRCIWPTGQLARAPSALEDASSVVACVSRAKEEPGSFERCLGYIIARDVYGGMRQNPRRIHAAST